VNVHARSEREESKVRQSAAVPALLVHLISSFERIGFGGTGEASGIVLRGVYTLGDTFSDF